MPPTKRTLERKMKPDVQVGDVITNRAFACTQGSQFFPGAWRCTAMAMKPFDHTTGQEEVWVTTFTKCEAGEFGPA
jgi:hypothetical protein